MNSNRHQQESVPSSEFSELGTAFTGINATYANSFLAAVPPIWTVACKIQAPFIALETLAHVGRIEMKIIRSFRSNGTVVGSKHLFRRIS